MANEIARRTNGWLDFNRDFGNDFFDFPMSSLFRNGWNLPHVSENMTMKTDIAESDKAYTVTVDLPGLKKENIQVDYEDGVLSVSGKQEQSSEEKGEQGEIIHSERYSGSYSRQYALPNVDREQISAKYDGGILTVTLPKTAVNAQRKAIEIQ